MPQGQFQARHAERHFEPLLHSLWLLTIVLLQQYQHSSSSTAMLLGQNHALSGSDVFQIYFSPETDIRPNEAVIAVYEDDINDQSTMASGQKRSQEKDTKFANIVSAYTSRFGKDDDQSRVTEEQRKKRQDIAAELADAYYDFASSAYENGWSTHFHYTPFAPHDTIQSAMAFYEHRLALLMGLKPGMKVLDVGCGIGGPAREIAKFVGCEVVGITINQSQVDRAILLTAQEGLSNKCTFVKADFLNLPFAPSSFDAAYAIEATVHSPSLEQVYTNISRVLKPGAVFGLSEWVMTPKFDASNPKHIGIRNRLERGNGLCNLHTSDQARQAMIKAGFEIFHDEDYAQHFAYPHENEDDGIKATLPDTRSPHRNWWWPLEGNTSHATTWTDWFTAWKMSKWPRRLCYALLWILECLGIADRGTCAAMTTLAYCVDSAVEGGREGIFTPCWWFIGRKVTQHGKES